MEIQFVEFLSGSRILKLGKPKKDNQRLETSPSSTFVSQATQGLCLLFLRTKMSHELTASA
jgi:hypothetical protein